MANAPANEKEAVAKTRGLAAFALQSVVADMDELVAAKHVTDGTNDNGIDALYVDLRDRRIYVVQSKWHDEGTGSISVGDMHKTVSGLRDLTEEKFDRFNKKFASTIGDIETALGDPAVTFCLVVAITGETKLAKEVQDVVDDALAEMNEISEMLTIKLLGLGELHQILREGGAAPKIDLDLTLEGWGSVSEPRQSDDRDDPPHPHHHPGAAGTVRAPDHAAPARGLALADRVRAAVHGNPRAATGHGQLTTAATTARPRTQWTTGMRRPELAPARGRSPHADQADATRHGLIGGSRLSVVA